MTIMQTMGPADTLNFYRIPQEGRQKHLFDRQIAFLCSSFKMNALSMSSKTESKHLSSPAAAMFFENEFNLNSLVTWLIMLLLIICPSSYKTRPDNLIGLYSFWSGIIPSQWSNARPNFPTKKCVGGAKFGLVSRLVACSNCIHPAHCNVTPENVKDLKHSLHLMSPPHYQ